MLTKTTASRDQLRKRVSRFLYSKAYSRPEITEVTERLQQLGRVLLFGGALRDLALHGNRHFPNDIDIVIDTENLSGLESTMEFFRAKRNRFGGYRFATQRWKFDVWRFNDTWAFREGYVSPTSEAALLRTTFFDWDAIAYDLHTRHFLMAVDYFERLQSRIVDINLEPNPNPLGNALRALAMYESGEASLTKRLASFVVSVIGSAGVDAADSNALEAANRIGAGNIGGRKVCRELTMAAVASCGRATTFKFEQLELGGALDRHRATRSPRTKSHAHRLAKRTPASG